MIKFVGTAQNGQESLLFFTKSNGDQTTLHFVKSRDGFQFEDKADEIRITDHEKNEQSIASCESLRVAKERDTYYLTYKPDAKTQVDLQSAMSTDLTSWEKIGTIQGVTETAVVVPDYKYRDHYVMYYGEKEIKIAYSAFLHHWRPQQTVLLNPREDKFDSGDLEVGSAYHRDDTILLLYYTKKNDDKGVRYSVGAALFDARQDGDPTDLVWRSEEPLWEVPEELHYQSLTPLGSAIHNSELILYWLIDGEHIVAASCQIPNKHTSPKSKVFSHIVKKYEKNPIIAPREDYPWESRATFNSAAIFDDGKVHFIYRALGDKDLSVLGYATSTDGITIDERSPEPIYFPREPFETPGGNAFATFADHYASGGGYGGIEDPRITKVENKLYLTYVAFDGANPPRAAMSNIDIEDFRKKDWGKWAKAKLISAPGIINKSAVIFPKKVKDKYVVLHRVYPNILVDYLDDLEFNDYLKGHHFIPPRKHFWDSKKIGAGAPPMETKDGWLLVYQSVGYQDPSRYKIGAMMLDKENPSKVLYRTDTPIIEPVEPYENDGFKAGVVYPCGSVIMNDKLHIYYGGADSYVNAATADIERFLYEMQHHQTPKLRRVTSGLMN
jgi:predicted GH43/DUF377 family glycosyl hydrolase